MHPDESIALLATLTAGFPREKVSAETIEIYAHDLADLDSDVAAKAIETLRQGSRFFPSIAEIRRAAAMIKIGAPEPMHAFEQAVTPAIDRHPVVQRARDLVGDNWMWRNEPPFFHRKPFLEAYGEVLERALLEVQQPALANATRSTFAGHEQQEFPQLPAGVPDVVLPSL